MEAHSEANADNEEHEEKSKTHKETESKKINKSISEAHLSEISVVDTGKQAE